jgi:hypothetical protein
MGATAIAAALVVVAIFIGAVEALGLVGDRLGWTLARRRRSQRQFDQFRFCRGRCVYRKLGRFDDRLSRQRMRQPAANRL